MRSTGGRAWQAAIRARGRHMIRDQRGFGLGFGGSVFETIGLPLIIMAVLGWFAWGAYGDYQARTRVAAGLARAAAAQAAVDKAFALRGSVAFPVALRSHWSPPAPDEFLQSIRIGDNGVITLRFTARVAEEGENQIQIVPVAQDRAIDLGAASSAGLKYAWQCGGAAGQSTVPTDRRPESCR